MNVARSDAATQPDTAEGRLLVALADGERITHLVPAIGCVVGLTPKRLLVVREGSAFRPKTGVRSWLLNEGLTMRAGLVRHGTGSLVIKWDRSATSVFIRAEEWEGALALVGAVRARVRIEEGLAREARRRPPEDLSD